VTPALLQQPGVWPEARGGRRHDHRTGSAERCDRTLCLRDKPSGGCNGEAACKRGSVGVGPKSGARWPSICAVYPEETDGPPIFLLDLAPSGVYRADAVTDAAGALLPHRFSLACESFTSKGERFHRRSLSVARPSGRPDLARASTLPGGAPTFLDTSANRRAATTRSPHHCSPERTGRAVQVRPGQTKSGADQAEQESSL
jgi:hypothetical protein